jgi:hypothetical protein
VYDNVILNSSTGTSGGRTRVSGTGVQTERTTCPAPLDAVRPIPSDEQYIPSLEFDVLVVLRSLCSCGEEEGRGNGREVVKMWKEAGSIARSNRHIQSWVQQLREL